MIKKYITYFFAVLTCAFITSCNNDIFTDDSDLPQITDITIEGEGGQWSSPFSRKGLAQIQIDYSSNDKKYVRYYNSQGNEVNSDCPASELGSIVYDNPRTWYSIGFLGEMIYINSIYNASRYAAFSIRLDYEYGDTKYINVTVTEGGKLSVVFWETSGSLKLEEDFSQSVHATSMTNNSSITQKLELNPFLDSKCSDMVMPADNWASGATVDIPMLTYDGSEWTWKEYKDIELGKRRDFTPSCYWDNKIVVEVPPYKKAKVSYKLNYTRATQDGVIIFSNSVAEQNYDVPATWTSVYATSYEYSVEYE